MDFAKGGYIRPPGSPDKGDEILVHLARCAYEEGGWLPIGVHVARNDTGEPIYVLSAAELADDKPSR